MAKKRVTLPKDFEQLLKEADIQTLKDIFIKCTYDARGGYSKQTALAYDNCPHDLAKWLIEQGADLYATDTWGNTPLHSRSRSIFGNVKSLLELGADVNYSSGSVGTPLHAAAGGHHAVHTTTLLEYGANPHLLNADGRTPLELALQTCSNIDIVRTVQLSSMYLNAGVKPTSQMQEYVTKIGNRFEFHRAKFNKESVDEVSNALDELYRLFDVVPVAKHVLHDGKSPITTKATTWQKQHQELWELLVPSSGPATTIQGELIRISGKIANELDGNGGGNWDSEYKKMVDAFLTFLEMGEQLSPAELLEAGEVVKAIKGRSGDTARLCQLAVKWVIANSSPLKLPKVEYKR